MNVAPFHSWGGWSDLFSCIVSLKRPEQIRQARSGIDCQHFFPVAVSSASDPDVSWSVTCSASLSFVPWPVAEPHRVYPPMFADRMFAPLRAMNFEDIFSADHKILNEEEEDSLNHQRYTICVTKFGHSMDSRLPMQNKSTTRNSDKLTECS